MNTYKRIEGRNGYEIITLIKETGEYIQNAIAADGLVIYSYISTVQEMGWRSVGEFLANRRGFVKEAC